MIATATATGNTANDFATAATAPAATDNGAATMD
jgi:hypothetical protein